MLDFFTFPNWFIYNIGTALVWFAIACVLGWLKDVEVLSSKFDDLVLGPIFVNIVLSAGIWILTLLI